MVKINIDQSDQYDTIEIKIKCPVIDKKIENMIMQINNCFSSLIGKINDKTYILNLENIYYIESIDDKTFIYEKDQVFECSSKLYELEENLKNSSFLRISKSCILNINKLQSVKSLLNGKYEAYLLNDEKVIVSRHYLAAFKNKFGL